MHNKLDFINQVIWCIGLSRKEHLSENDRGTLEEEELLGYGFNLLPQKGYKL